MNTKLIISNTRHKSTIALKLMKFFVRPKYLIKYKLDFLIFIIIDIRI